ncbi:hypothetical protein EDB81DRAFT_178034 [Dactylonectria macrodidyma]|uniref:Uncharacterized protein n=1 Tax=Dactylonectria macrodidyma TaxID=307937 RepID=A0A9P9FQH5_9HYPO|nr:hypothetical protein EDB81DRAFT_178034 [Dactylonectria macrodidyma]
MKIPFQQCVRLQSLLASYCLLTHIMFYLTLVSTNPSVIHLHASTIQLSRMPRPQTPHRFHRETSGNVIFSPMVSAFAGFVSAYPPHRPGQYQVDWNAAHCAGSRNLAHLKELEESRPKPPPRPDPGDHGVEKSKLARSRATKSVNSEPKLRRSCKFIRPVVLSVDCWGEGFFFK